MKTQQVLHILHLTDGNRGGSQRHVIDLCRGGTPGIRHFVLRATPDSISLHDATGERVLVLDRLGGDDDLPAILRTVIGELGIGCVHAHALPVLLEATGATGTWPVAVPLLVTLHDLACIDPALFTSPGPAPHPDPEWIARCAPVLRAAQAVIVPSAYLAREVLAHYPGVAPVVIPNGIAPAPAAPLPLTPPWPASARTFAVIGAVGPHKGSEVLRRVAGALADPDVVGVVIGYTEAQLTPGWVVPGRLYVHGPYDPDELPGLIAAYGVRLAYFPNLVPESFSYTLSEAWQAGIPALAPATGAIGERVRATGAGWLLDDPRDARSAAAAIERLLAPAGAAALAAACGKIGAPACVPDLTAMRTAVDQVYRGIAPPSPDAVDPAWVRLKNGWRSRLFARSADCALDAATPAILREERSLREWNAKLAADVAAVETRAKADRADALSGAARMESDVQRLKAWNDKLQSDAQQLRASNDHLEADAQRFKSWIGKLESDVQQLKAANEGLETDVQRLRAWNDRIETDVLALGDRNRELERDLATQKARNGKVEGDAAVLARRNRDLEDSVAALRARNLHVEADTLALGRRNIQLEGDIVGLIQRNIELDTDVVALKTRNTLVEADIVALKQRNSRVERDAAALQGEIAAMRDAAAEAARIAAAASAARAGHLERVESELSAGRARILHLEHALSRLPSFIQNWLQRHVR